MRTTALYHRRRFRLAALAAGIAAAGALAFAGTASAATLPTGPGQLPTTISASNAGMAQKASTVLTPDAVIECTAKVNNPHYSSHVPGTVNATGSVTCDAPVDSITFTMYLNLEGYEIAQSTFVNDGGASLSGNVAYVCAQGTTHPYQAFLVGEVDFPAGYSPPIGALGNQSPSVSVTCG